MDALPPGDGSRAAARRLGQPAGVDGARCGVERDHASLRRDAGARRHRAGRCHGRSLPTRGSTTGRWRPRARRHGTFESGDDGQGHGLRLPAHACNRQGAGAAGRCTATAVKSEHGQASYYYSQPFFEVDGTLTHRRREVAVTGRAWMDREWSSQPLAADQKGWDWFSLHLASGEKLMLFRLRGASGKRVPRRNLDQAGWDT